LNERFPAVDPLAARRAFERAARTYAGASRLEAEVGARMLERLDYLKIAPRAILDAGSGPSREAKALFSRYGKARYVSLDSSIGMLRSGRARFFERKDLVCADLARLPLAAGSIDLVWSNMALHWTEPLPALREFHRVLAPEGLLMFTTLGPDSLKELRVAAGAARVHEFIDMHDLGDMLVAAGFSAPVMDMEMLRIAYRSPGALLEDLRASGQTNRRADRRRGLAAPRWLEQVRAALGTQASFEVIYGHAWKGAPRKVQDGRDIVQFHRASLR
jgi:malonyl-CoA O-methyltransferase